MWHGQPAHLEQVHADIVDDGPLSLGDLRNYLQQ
jgi:hypothetical protein